MAGGRVGTNNFAVADWIVDGGGLSRGATHTTIAAALADASSGDNIVIRPGTYTENLTLKAGVNLSGVGTDRTQVIIVGKNSCSYSGAVYIDGIQLQTNSDFCIEITGANATEIFLNNCTITASNNTAISNSGSNASSMISIHNSTANINTTGIALFSVSSGVLTIDNVLGNNAGATTTANAFSGASINLRFVFFGNPLTTSGTTAILSANHSYWALGQNVTALNHNSTSATAGVVTHCAFSSGNQTPITVGAGATLQLLDVSLSHTNAAAVSGSGTLTYSGIQQIQTVGTLGVTTQTGKGVQGQVSGTAPAVGNIGQTIESKVASGSAVSLTTTTAANVTSISLTAGIWDVSFMACFTGGAITGSQTIAAISSVSATLGTNGDNQCSAPTVPTAGSDWTLTVPQFRISLSATTTYYAVVRATFTVGTVSAYGRISATRVA